MFLPVAFLLGLISIVNPMAVKCPECQQLNNRTLEVRVLNDDTAVRRRKICKDCGARWTTYERYEIPYNFNVCGSKNHNSVLLEKNIRDIRKEFHEGTGCLELSRKYGVSQSTISRIIRRVTWGHVT